MSNKIAGAWDLVGWRRLQDGVPIAYPLGDNPIGILIYTPDFRMAVQMMAAGRPPIDSTDALGGPTEERAAAYSTCLAYFGSYELEEDVVTHKLVGALYPNWSGTVQSRPLTLDGDVLVLRTPPDSSSGHTVVNEMSWSRSKHC